MAAIEPEPTRRHLRRRRWLDPAVGSAILLWTLAAPHTAAEDREAEATPVRSFRNFDRRNSPGLPQSTVTALYQDAKGVLWIATLDGLAFFDGTRIRPVAETPGAPERGALRSLARRRAGGFYAGGPTAVHVFDGASWSVIPAPGASFSLAEDEEGVLWRVDQSGRVLILRESSGPLSWSVPALPVEVDRAVSVRSGADGSLWLALEGGVLRRRAGEWETLGGGEPPSPVTAFLAASDGSAWIGTDGGRIYRAPADAAWSEIGLERSNGAWIRVLAEDRRGRIWAGDNAGGVAFGKPGEPWTYWDVYNGLHPEARMVIFADREGTIWFAANGHGLQQWVGEAWSHRNLWNGDAIPERRALVFGITGTRDGGFLAAVFNRGLWHWDGRRMHQYGEAEGLTPDVRMAVEPRPGVIWVGVRYGIYESRGGGRFRQVFRLQDGFVYGFYRSTDGTWYAPTSSAGILRLTPTGWQEAEELNRALPNANVRGLLFRRNGELWAATMGGIVAFGSDGAELVGSSTDAVNALLEVDGEVWAGGFQGIRIWGEDAHRDLTVADGAPGPTIYSLARAADGAVWAGGSRGVGRFADGRFRVYDLSNGLIEAECNLNGLWPADDGSVLVGTMASLARFDAAVEPLAPPPLGVRWRDRPAPGPDGVARLPSSPRSIRLSWAAPWLDPKPVEYRVRIARLDPAWSPPRLERSLTLENLGPGEWEVEVAARFVGEEEWTEPIAARFRIAPFFRETWTFYVLCAAGVLVAAVAAVRFRTQALSRRARRLEEAVREQLAEIKVLGGLLPICASCKKVRDDAGYWQQIESYIRQHSEAEFSHGLCPECFVEHYPEYVREETREV